MPLTTPRLGLPYPVPDDQVDVPRDVEALAEALEALPDLGAPYPALGCHVTGVTAAWTSGDKQIGADGTTNPPVRANPAGSLVGGVWTVPAGQAGLWRFTLHARLDNCSAGKSVRGKHVKNGGASSSWNLVWAYGSTAGAYPQGQGSMEIAMAVGDTFTAIVAHDDTGARTVTWRFSAERIT
jgi:hypothetical protein